MGTGLFQRSTSGNGCPSCKPFLFRHMNYYQHHIGDFDKKTRHLTRIERSVYRDLLELYYTIEGQICMSIPELCRKIIARTNEESTSVEQVLNEFFIKTPTGWFHERCEEEIDKFKSSNSQKSEAGKASAAKKALKRQQALNGESTSVEQTCNGTSTNQEPITNNQEPRTKKKNTTSSDADDMFAGIEEQIVSDYKKLRKAKNMPATKTAMDGVKREAEKAGLSFADTIRLCCERGWAGFNAKWILEPRESQQRKESSHSGFEKLDYSEGIGEDGKIL